VLFLKRYAAIDIGSNTILLLIGELLAEGAFKVVLDTGEPTRLGRGLTRGGKLDLISVQASIDCLKRFSSRCRKEGVEATAAVGTRALRLAQDADQFLQHVRRECNITPRIISEEQEALLSFLSVQRDPGMPRNAAVMDVGGGSTEYTFHREEGSSHPVQTISLPLGAISLTEEFFRHDPPSHAEITRLSTEINKTLLRLPPATQGELVGIGGTATSLGSMQLGLDTFARDKIHGMQLTVDELRGQIRELQTKDLAARRQITGLPPERADIILAGAMIILSSMERLKKDAIHISCYGLRYGLFYQEFMSAG
jgi:exopolyphosphatase/guanosine-5'-triphosphate,3'-diphosphate pyrophosphatase